MVKDTKKKGKEKHKRIYSPIKRKILLLLMAGIGLGMTRSPRTQRYIFSRLIKEWKDIDKQYLYRIMNEFRHERLVDYKENKDGTIKIVLTEKGKRKVISFKIDDMKIKKPIRWDRKWRIVMFDVPEKRRWGRDAIRNKLKELGFYELQKSVFIYPYNCQNEIDFIIEYFQIRNYVRYAELSDMTNEAELKLHFKLK